MTSDNQSYLRFSVEESVWFQKGQEVSALLSISLDPNIVIQEDNQYVSIRGALELTGEYRIDEETIHEDTRDFTSVRVVNEVITREDGISELKHSFPVDITIPKNRIQNMDDVYVAIDSFDYELPRNGCLQLVADLSISGIYGSQQSVPMVESLGEDNEVEEQDDSSQRYEAENEVFVEAEPEPVLNEVSDVSNELVDVEPVKDELTEEAEPQRPEEAVASVEAEESQEPERTEITSVESQEREPELLLRGSKEEDEEVQSVNTGLYDSSSKDMRNQAEEDDDDLFSPFEVEARKEVYYESEVEEEEKSEESPVLELVPDQNEQEEQEEQEIAEEPVLEAVRESEPQLELVEEQELENEHVKQPTLQVELKGRAEEKFNFGSSSISKGVTAVEERENQGKKAYTGKKTSAKVEDEQDSQARDENTLYLTKIFARDDEEDFTRMKICIVQQGDNLEKISERYEVTIQSLVRVNQLSDDYSVNEGQLLYIPKSR